MLKKIFITTFFLAAAISLAKHSALQIFLKKIVNTYSFSNQTIKSINSVTKKGISESYFFRNDTMALKFFLL